MWDAFCDLSEKEKQSCFDELNAYIEGLRREPDLRELFIEMTIHCNQHCIHCGSNCGDVVSRGALSDREILNMLVELRNDLAAREKPLPFLSITGGEPLVRPGFTELMKKVHSLGYSWGMTSNGTLITSGVARQLKEAGMYSIGLSIDGLREVHEWFRQSPGSYEATLAALDALQREEFADVMVTTVVHRQNLSQLEDIYRMLKKHGVRSWRLINIEPIGRAVQNAELALKPEQYRYMFDFMVEKQKDPDMQLLFTCNHFVGLSRERVIRPWFFFCRAGLQVAAIQYDGTIGACLDIERRSDLAYGNVRERHILEAWENGFGVFREHKEEKSSKCRDCEHKKNCMGGGFHTWDTDRCEPRICMMEMLGEKQENGERKTEGKLC